MTVSRYSLSSDRCELFEWIMYSTSLLVKTSCMQYACGSSIGLLSFEMPWLFCMPCNAMWQSEEYCLICGQNEDGRRRVMLPDLPRMFCEGEISRGPNATPKLGDDMVSKKRKRE